MHLPQYQQHNIIPASSFADIGLQLMPVSPLLSQWVQCLWLLMENSCGTSVYQEKLYPDAGSSLTFEITPTHASVALFHHAQVCTQPWILTNRYISIRLRPGAARALFGVTLEATDNHQVALPRTDALCRLLDSLPALSAALQVRVIEDWLSGIEIRTSDSGQRWSQILQQAFVGLIPPQQLATEFGYSRRTLERHWRKQFGFTPNQLYGFAQIRHAREQLIATQDELSDIALRCGFYDQAHFTNVFRERALETPLQYRKRKLSQISN